MDVPCQQIVTETKSETFAAPPGGSVWNRSAEMDAALLQLADVIRDLYAVLQTHASQWSAQSHEERLKSALRVLRDL